MIFDLFLFFYLLAISPKILFEWLKGKKRFGLVERLNASIPDPEGKSVIWIHAVSVGETKSAQPLFKILKKEYPDAFFLITSTTATGQAEAKRSLSQADAFRFLPFDFTWIVKRWVDALKPKLFVLVESDFWPNLLYALKKQGTKTALVSGKLSERSSERFRRISFLAKKLFGRFELLSLQNDEMKDRFLPLVSDSSKLKIGGNLKLDFEPQKVEIPNELKNFSPAITLSCTHDPEEDLLLDALASGPWVYFLAPRHPERFDEVAYLLEKKKISYVRWSRLKEIKGNEKVVLVDAMGQLPICYSLSRLAIVAGSFTPKVGGHNVFEPCLYGCPSLFGPYTYSQTEFAKKVLEAGAGVQLRPEALKNMVEEVFHSPKKMAEAALALSLSNRGVAEKTLSQIQALFHVQ